MPCICHAFAMHVRGSASALSGLGSVHRTKRHTLAVVVVVVVGDIGVIVIIAFQVVADLRILI